MIARPEYMKQLMSLKDLRPIKVITGVRRCGKSTLLQMYQEELLKQGIKPEQIQYINLEDTENVHLLDHLDLYYHIKNKLVPDKQNYVFIDEAQMCYKYGKVADSLYLRGNVDVYITGSTSRIRPSIFYKEINRETLSMTILPLSFKEFYSEWKRLYHEGDAYTALKEYMLYGGLPFIFKYRISSKGDGVYDAWDVQGLRQYLGSIVTKIIEDDIIENRKNTDKGRLESIIKFMADNISQETAINKIANTMVSHGYKMDNRTVESYVYSICESFLFDRVGRYEIKGRGHLNHHYKYYLVDVGFRQALLGDKKEGTGKVLENIVYLELIRRGCSVETGKIGKKEVDFIAQDWNTTAYYQVADTMIGSDTYKREFASINSIPDHYPKYILTRDYLSDKPNGVFVKSVVSWLLE